MKLKARDVIAGWPRGKSQSQPYIPSLDSFNFLIFGRSYWDDLDLFNLRVDLGNEFLYHRDQQVMLDRHRSEYRRPTSAWLARKILASGAGLVIATCGETPDTITLGEPEKPWQFAPSKNPPITGFKEDQPGKDRILYTNVVIDEREQRGEMKRP
jgi:hypothetical protein